MPTVHFSGRVLPSALSVSIPNRPSFKWKAEDLGLDMLFRVRIQDGSIAIDCEVNIFQESAHLVPLFMRASDIAKASVNLAAFASGVSLIVVLETFTDPSGATVPLAAQRPSLEARAAAVRVGTADFDRFLDLVLAEPPLFRALNDLIEALSSPQRAGMSCARAMRSLWLYFGRSGALPEAARLSLRDKLQIDLSYVRKIMRQDHPTAAPDTSADVIERAWIVMNRFLEYRKRGQPLPLSEFPLLT